MESVFMASYSFSILETLPSIHEPLKYLSISSEDPSFHQQIQNWPASYYYKETEFTQLPQLLTHLQDSQNYNLRVELHQNKLIYTSGVTNLTLTLSENTYAHNSYVGRYLRFIKHVPPKYGPNLDTFYTATVSLSTNTKYYKDLSVLLAKVFAVCTVSLLLAHEVPFPLGIVQPKYLSTQVSSHSDLRALSVKQISSDDAHDFYEYLCLLHLDGLPDYNNSHVQATTMYEIPEVTFEKDIRELHLLVTRDINPSVLTLLISSEGWISVFARSESQNIVLLRTASGIYMWSIHK